MRKEITAKRHIRSVLLLLLILIAPLSLFANEPDTVYIPWHKFKFPKATENILVDSSQSLRPFFDQLRKLKMDNNQVVSIAHIGDSHIQADAQTSVTRRLFQEYFGSAGRGLIAPLRLIKTNEPDNYRISSPQVWEGVRLIKPGMYPVGITGMTAANKDSEATVSMEAVDKYNPDRWSFSDITVYYDTATTQLGLPDSSLGVIQEASSPFFRQITLDTLVNTIQLNFSSRDQAPVLFYGANLKNGRNGILYHAIGINGAHYEEYFNAGLFLDQLPTLGASLIIISMGTNEAYDRGFESAQFYASIDRTIKRIREKCPEAIFILTTPAETWFKYKTKKRKPHPNMAIASKVIVQYAQDHQMAYWDLFSITGGKGSALTWKKHNLLSKDGVHFSKEGYEFMGELFFQAIHNSYRKNQ